MILDSDLLFRATLYFARIVCMVPDVQIYPNIASKKRSLCSSLDNVAAHDSTKPSLLLFNLSFVILIINGYPIFPYCCSVVCWYPDTYFAGCYPAISASINILFDASYHLDCRSIDRFINK